MIDFPSRPCAAEARKALAAAVAGNADRKRLFDEVEAREMETSVARMLGPKPAKTKQATRVERIKAADAALKAEILADLEKLAKQHPGSAEGKRAGADRQALRADKSLQAAGGAPRAF